MLTLRISLSRQRAAQTRRSETTFGPDASQPEGSHGRVNARRHILEPCPDSLTGPPDRSLTGASGLEFFSFFTS